jgi:mRNA interferase RelE/StbE
LTTCKLTFDRRALKEWHKLDADIRRQFKRKLAQVLEHPRIPANRLHGLPDCYKIKLRSAGYRLIYQVRDEEILVFVVAIGVRDKNRAYGKARNRLPDDESGVQDRPSDQSETLFT